MGVRARALLLLMAVFFTTEARAVIIDPSSFANPQQILSFSTPLIRTIAFATGQQAYEPATPLGTQLGLDFGVQLAVFKVPDDFNDALRAAGAGSGNVPVLPVPRINVHKGLGDWMDLGVTWAQYREFRLLGGDIKVAVFMPEEGPTWAVRLNYSTTHIKFASGGSTLEFDTHSIKPEILVSRKLDFVDPYLGVGYQFAQGKLNILVPIDPTLSLGSSASAHASGAIAFLGVGMHIPPLGLKLTVDGEYSTTGADSIGTKVGFSF